METKIKRSRDVLESPQPVGEKAPAFAPRGASQVLEERANVARSAFREAIAKLGDIFGVDIDREANPVESFANVLALVQKLRDDLKIVILSDPKIDSGRRASRERILSRTLDNALALQSLSAKLDPVGPQMRTPAQEGGDESLSMIISSVNRLATSLPIRVARLQRVLSILVSKRDQQDVPIEGLISDLYERELSSNLSTNQVELGELAELSRPIGISEGFGSGGKTVLVSNGEVLELNRRLLHEGSMVVCNGAGDLVPLERFIERQLPEVEIWQEVSLLRGSDNSRLPQLTYDVSPNCLMQFGVPHRCTLVDLKFIGADGSPIEADNLSLKRSVFGAWQVQLPSEAVKMVATVAQSDWSGISDNLRNSLQQLLPRTVIPLDRYMQITLAQALKEPDLARRAMIVANGFAENGPVYHISNQLGQALSAAGSNRLAFLSGLHGGTCATMSAQLINLLNLVGVPAKYDRGLTIRDGETNYRGDPDHAVVRCFVPGGRDLVFDPTTWTISGRFEPERLEDSGWSDLIQSLQNADESEAFELGRNLRKRLYTEEPSWDTRGLSRGHQLRDDRDPTKGLDSVAELTAQLHRRLIDAHEAAKRGETDLIISILAEVNMSKFDIVLHPEFLESADELGASVQMINRVVAAYAANEISSDIDKAAGLAAMVDKLSSSWISKWTHHTTGALIIREMEALLCKGAGSKFDIITVLDSLEPARSDSNVRLIERQAWQDQVDVLLRLSSEFVRSGEDDEAHRDLLLACLTKHLIFADKLATDGSDERGDKDVGRLYLGQLSDKLSDLIKLCELRFVDLLYLDSKDLRAVVDNIPHFKYAREPAYPSSALCEEMAHLLAEYYLQDHHAIFSCWLRELRGHFPNLKSLFDFGRYRDQILKKLLKDGIPDFEHGFPGDNNPMAKAMFSEFGPRSKDKRKTIQGLVEIGMVDLEDLRALWPDTDSEPGLLEAKLMTGMFVRVYPDSCSIRLSEFSEGLVFSCHHLLLAELFPDQVDQDTLALKRIYDALPESLHREYNKDLPFSKSLKFFKTWRTLDPEGFESKVKRELQSLMPPEEVQQGIRDAISQVLGGHLNDPTQAELLLEAAHDSVIHLHTEMAIKYQEQGLDDPLAKATEDIGKLLASIREIDLSNPGSLSNLSDICSSTQIGKVSPIEKLALLELCRANWDGLWGLPVSWPRLVRDDNFLHSNKIAQAFYKRPFESIKQQVVLRKFNFSSLALSPEHSFRVASSLSEKIAQRPKFSARGGWRDLVLTGDARGRRAVPDRTDEIGQLRQYVSEDDPRRVDWRASGKSETLLVRSHLGGSPRQSESFKLKIDAEALIAPGKNREQILTAIYDFIQVTRLEKRSVAVDVEVSYRGVVLQEIEASEVEEAFMRGKPLGMDLLLRLERIGEDAYRVAKSLAQINSAGSAAFDTVASVPSDRSRGGGKNSTINVLVCHPTNRVPTLTALDAAKIESFVLWPR